MAKGGLRKEYQHLNRAQLLQKSYELGRDYEMMSQSCSQSVVAALWSLLEIDDIVVKVSSSLSGGTAVQFLGTCGALCGGVIVLDYYFGRDIRHISHQERIQENVDASSSGFQIAQSLADRFWKEYGTIICVQIQRQLFGRFFYALDPDEIVKIEAAGAHSDPNKCGHIVGNATRWVMEILLEEGMIKANV